MWAVYYLSINTVGDWGTGWANDTFFGEIVGPWVDGFIGTAPAGSAWWPSLPSFSP